MFSKWMLENPIRWFCIGLACQWTTVLSGQGKFSTSQKPCRNSERHNHHRYQIHQFCRSICRFFIGEMCTLLDVTRGVNPDMF